MKNAREPPEGIPLQHITWDDYTGKRLSSGQAILDCLSRTRIRWRALARGC